MIICMAGLFRKRLTIDAMNDADQPHEQEVAQTGEITFGHPAKNAAHGEGPGTDEKGGGN